MSELTGDPRSYSSERYALSGKIMLSAIIILFAVVVLIVCLHIYARWYLERARRRQRRLLRNRRRNSRAHIIFTSDIPSTTFSHGLDASVLKSLPTFTFSSTTHGDDLLECAVCLSEFEENEHGRILPKCNHSFHIGCIDMWFHSHSTCPLCRSPVETPQTETETTPIEIVIDSPNSTPENGNEEMGSSSFSSASTTTTSCSDPNNQNPLSSVGCRRKGFEMVGVSIPRRNESFKSFEEGSSKSPGGRILSFKRMLSRDRRPSTPMPLSSSAIDFEKGETQGSSPSPNYCYDRQRTPIASS